MKIARQTPDKLVVSTNSRANMLVIGALLVIAGGLMMALVRVHPVTFQDLRPPSLLMQQHVRNPATDSEIETITTNEAGYQIANYLGHLIFIRERPFITLAIASIVLGAIILLGPYWGARVTFDKAREQVQLKQARWFFRSAVERYPFSELYEVRIERDRSKNRPEKSFGANLVFSHHEGAPLSRDYINYKTVFPLSESFRYDYQSVEAIVNRIRAFMAEFRKY
jgi:hypothetical protein